MEDRIEPSRRALLAGVASVAAGVAGLGLAGAGLLAGGARPAAAKAPPAGKQAPTAGKQAPPAGKQVPSAYRYKVGDAEVTVIADGLRTMPLPETFVRNQPKDAVNAALRAAYLAENELSIPFNVLLLNTGGRLVLVDSGNGPQPAGAPVGLLRGTLGALGVAPEAVDEVVISHFHADHINGLVTAEGTAAFPNAEVKVPEAEWAFWMDDGAMSRAPEGQKAGFQNARRVFAPLKDKVSRYAWEKEVAPGLTAVAAPGHTPGHTAFALQSGAGTLFIQSDITNIPALFMRNPGWHAMFDMDPAKAEETRRRTYDRLAADRTRVAGYHFPFPAVAHVEKDGDGFRYVPVLWRPVL